jgi:cell division protein FtsZ
MALMGTGIAKGENRALEAAQRAISSPLLEETSVQGARGVLINISGGTDMTLHEVAEAARIIQESVDEEANIISGMVIDETLEDSMKVTVIATGFDISRSSTAPALRPVATHRPSPAPAQHEAAGDDEGFPFRRPERRPTPEPARPNPAPADEQPAEEPEHVPFYRKVIAHARGEDPSGYGPNWSQVDDYDIPTVLRKQMD